MKTRPLEFTSKVGLFILDFIIAQLLDINFQHLLLSSFIGIIMIFLWLRLLISNLFVIRVLKIL